MRIALLLFALLGLLPKALPAIANGNDWDFAPPDAHPVLLLEARKPQSKEQHSGASERAHDCAGPRGSVWPDCGARSADTQPCLSRSTTRLGPDSTGPPA